MLELFDEGRMAAKHGKWRGMVIAACSLAPAGLALALARLEWVLLKYRATSQPEDFSALAWCALGLALLAQLLLIWGSWQLYRDHVHGDHYIDAEHYGDHGF